MIKQCPIRRRICMKKILPILVAVLIASISSCHSQKARQESEQQKSLEYSIFDIEMPHQNFDINELNVENPKVKIIK